MKYKKPKRGIRKQHNTRKQREEAKTDDREEEKLLQ